MSTIVVSKDSTSQKTFGVILRRGRLFVVPIINQITADSEIGSLHFINSIKTF